MEEFIDFTAGFQEAAEDRDPLQPHDFDLPISSSSQEHLNDAHLYPDMARGIGSEPRPRLTKEQTDMLEGHFQKQHKPSTTTKKGFAATLGVPQEKINNWFQNRRARAKTDAKKVQGALNLYQAHQPNYNADLETSPFYTSSQHSAVMQQWSAEDPADNALSISGLQQPEEPTHTPEQSSHAGMPDAELLENPHWQIPENMYIPSDNRRTLTQENFDAIAKDGRMMNAAGQFEDLEASFCGDQEALNKVFPTYEYKQQDLEFPYPPEAPLSSNDSTVPSTISDQFLHTFPSSAALQNHANMSVTSSEWSDSRSSSISALQQDSTSPQVSSAHQRPVTTTSQWQPGSSVPVDLSRHYEEFRQAAQARASESQFQSYEQPLAFPNDEAYVRRNSQASMLAQSMDNIVINTPHTHQSNVFKTPAPPTTIAARRQRPRPAALGLASMRSQSCSGASQPASPGYPQQQQISFSQDQQVRRIRSAAVMNGGVQHGRIMKSTPGSAQRSPLNWTFNDALNSPTMVRQVSQGNLAPPTPRTPSEFPRSELPRPIPTWQGHVHRQPSINEHDFEQGQAYQPFAMAPGHEFSSSPPHTPMYYDNPYVSRRIGSNVITENTPPQSAPAGQSCFPANIFGSVQPAQQQFAYMQAPVPQPMHVNTAFQPHQYANMIPSDQQYHVPNVTFTPNQQANVTASGPPPGVPLQFASGIPTFDADGTAKIAFPPQMQLMQQQSQQMQSQPHPQYGMMISSGLSPGHMMASQPPKQSTTDWAPQQWTPPPDIKGASTPRRAIDSGPKNYTFSHTGPELFEGKKVKRSVKDSTGNTPN